MSDYEKYLLEDQKRVIRHPSSRSPFYNKDSEQVKSIIAKCNAGNFLLAAKEIVNTYNVNGRVGRWRNNNAILFLIYLAKEHNIKDNSLRLEVVRLMQEAGVLRD